MSSVRFLPTEIPEVLRIEPQIFRDPRGFFVESWNAKTFAEGGIDVDFVQDNHSHSVRGVLRGLHYQVNRPQGKLVWLARGEVFDVAVDLRRSAPSFGRWVGVWLSADRHEMLWIPPGFAHGFYVTSPRADLLYKCTDLYSPADERTLRWNDIDLAIDWPLRDDSPLLLSDKDAAGVAFAEAETFP